VVRPARDAATRAMFSFGAQFCEVRVDPELGEARVSRMLGVFAAGRILNVKTARSQIIGGMVWTVGMAPIEESSMDHRLGRFSTRNLSDYLLPVHADVPSIDALFVAEEDPYVNELGVKGIGEIGIVGVAAAIGNAIFNAMGKRLRSLPLRGEHLLAHLRKAITRPFRLAI
jgi:xanthine dehydrogenase YagR molybdenum-binding subunit